MQFFRNFPETAPLNNNLTWSHYKYLLTINDEDLRDDLATKANDEKWNVQKLGSKIKEVKNEKATKPAPSIVQTKITTFTKPRSLMWSMATL